MVDSVSRFTATVADYVKYRPSYPDVLFAFLSSKLGPTTSGFALAELGAGTGIFTRQLAAQAFAKKIYAVEPNDEMRNAAAIENRTDKVEFLKGTAEVSGLESETVNGVLGAQCFHWFNLDRALPEINRIAKPGSLCFAIWNDRIEAGFNVDLERILLQYSAPYATLRRPDGTIKDLQQRIPTGVEEAFDYRQLLTLEMLIGRLASTSYVQHGVNDRENFNKALTEAFNRHEKNGHIVMEYRTRVFYWRTPIGKSSL